MYGRIRIEKLELQGHRTTVVAVIHAIFLQCSGNDLCFFRQAPRVEVSLGQCRVQLEQHALHRILGAWITSIRPGSRVDEPVFPILGKRKNHRMFDDTVLQFLRPYETGDHGKACSTPASCLPTESFVGITHTRACYVPDIEGCTVDNAIKDASVLRHLPGQLPERVDNHDVPVGRILGPHCGVNWHASLGTPVPILVPCIERVRRLGEKERHIVRIHYPE